MARTFVSSNPDKLQVEAASVTATPLTMVGWFKADDDTKQYRICSIGDPNKANHGFALMASGVGGNDINAATGQDGFVASSDPLPAFTAGTWHHAGGTFDSSTHRLAWSNGTQGSVSTLDKTPIFDTNRMTIGISAYSGQPFAFGGELAEIALWNVSLSADEMQALAVGVSPLRIRLGNLKGYWPILGMSPEPDFSGQGNHMAVTGTTIADHAPVAPQFGMVGMDLGLSLPPPPGQPFRIRGMMVPGFAGGRFGRVA